MKNWKVTLFILGEYEQCDPVKFTKAQNGDYQSYYTEDEFKNDMLPRKIAKKTKQKPYPSPQAHQQGLRP